MVGETMNKEQELKKEFEKEQKKCINSYDTKGNEWNKWHFKYCKADLIKAKLSGYWESKKEFIKAIDKFIGKDDVRAIELKKEMRK